MLFLINLKRLRKVLETHLVEEAYDPSDVGKGISIKRKKKIILEETPNGGVKSKRRNVIKIEIIE